MIHKVNQRYNENAIDKIIATPRYLQQKKMGRKDLELLLNGKLKEALGKEGNETEFRFGTYLVKKGKMEFSSHVPYAAFDRLRTHLEKTQSVKPNYSTVLLYAEDIRQIIQGDKKVWEHKSRTFLHDFLEYGIRLSKSKESKPASIPKDIPSKRRSRARWTYDFPNYRVDMTEVSTEILASSPEAPEARNTGAAVTYEVEVESKNGKQIGGYVATFFEILHDTKMVYTEATRVNMVTQVSGSLGVQVDSFEKPPTINHGILTEARNLKKADLVWGGLLGGSTNFTVTHKTDGVRKLLIFHRTGVWLAYPPYEYNLISEALTDTISVFDGELVATDSSSRFFIFDCLVCEPQSSNTTRENTHLSRLSDAKKFFSSKFPGSGDITIGGYQIIQKDFWAINSVDEFFSIMRDRFLAIPSLGYTQDGFVFTPIKAPYALWPTGRLPPIKERVLTQHLDICKWKPNSQLTIDFMYRNGTLYSWNSKTKDYEEFLGANYLPYTGEADMSSFKERNIPFENRVVEFGWDADNNRFLPARLRGDKAKPNRVEVAIDNWKTIHDPLTQATLQGVSLDLMRRYHNRIKTDLFSGLLKGSTLLDIGSGVGGDVRKWATFKSNDNRLQYVAVEPDQDKLEELKRRIILANLDKKVRILQAGGEDTQQLSAAVQSVSSDGKVDVIALMFSLTFFWRDEATLKQLVTTIDTLLAPGGQVIFITFDGDAVLEAFEPLFGNYKASEITFGNAGLQLNGSFSFDAPSTYSLQLAAPQEPGKGRQLTVSIPETIVGGKQVEYLAHVGDLQLLLQPHGIYLSSFRYATTEPFLNPGERLYTKMVSYGIFERAALPEEREATPPLNLRNVQSQLPQTPYGPERPLPPMFQSLQSAPRAPARLEPILLFDPKYDDYYAPLPRSRKWHIPSNLVRLATLGGKHSSLFHAVVKAFYKKYQDVGGDNRISLVKKLMADLGNWLAKPLQGGSQNSVWEASNNRYPAKYLASLMQGGSKYSLAALRAKLGDDEQANVAEDFVGLLRDAFQLDIYVCQNTASGLVPVSTTFQDYGEDEVYGLVIVEGQSDGQLCYETVASEAKNGLFQTVFQQNDPLLASLRRVLEDYIRDHPHVKNPNLELAKLFAENGAQRTLSTLSADDPLVLASLRDEVVKSFEAESIAQAQAAKMSKSTPVSKPKPTKLQAAKVALPVKRPAPSQTSTKSPAQAPGAAPGPTTPLASPAPGAPAVGRGARSAPKVSPATATPPAKK